MMQFVRASITRDTRIPLAVQALVEKEAIAGILRCSVAIPIIAKLCEVRLRPASQRIDLRSVTPLDAATFGNPVEYPQEMLSDRWIRRIAPWPRFEATQLANAFADARLLEQGLVAHASDNPQQLTAGSAVGSLCAAELAVLRLARTIVRRCRPITTGEPRQHTTAPAPPFAFAVAPLHIATAFSTPTAASSTLALIHN